MENVPNVDITSSFLNLRYYNGKDLYSDGVIEDTLLDICSNKRFEEALKEHCEWPILYHLSPERENLLEWYDFEKDSRVLEIGAGCGALTGLLCRKTGYVTAVELSEKRSRINAMRNRACGNLEIIVGNYQDIIWHSKFDYVTLVGVLEYAGSYISGVDPFERLLKSARDLLNDGGHLIIAIENKYGLKYFNGASESHSGRIFDGIEDYPRKTPAQTFSKPELEDMIRRSGFLKQDFYYPIPDYKLPNTIYSDEYLPQVGNLRIAEETYDNDRFLLFNEDMAFDGICRSGMFPYFSNSFLVIVER